MAPSSAVAAACVIGGTLSQSPVIQTGAVSRPMSRYISAACSSLIPAPGSAESEATIASVFAAGAPHAASRAAALSAEVLSAAEKRA